MKTKLFTLFIGFLSITTSFAQTKKENIKVTYHTDFILDYEKIKDNIPAEYRASFKSEIDRGISVNFELQSNGKISIFKPEMKVNNAQDQGGVIAQQIMQAESNPIFKDYEKNEFYNVKEIGGKTFLIKDSLHNYNWKITKEKDKINGYPVTKAIGTDEDGAEVVAWYATSLPYKDGPYRFSNLPGLIVKAEFSTPEFKTIFTMKNLTIEEKAIVVNLPTKGKVVSDKEFMDEMKVLNEKYKQANQGVDTSK